MDRLRNLAILLALSTAIGFQCANARDIETIKTTQEVVPVETSTTTVIPADPVLIQDSFGSTTIVQPAGTATVETRSVAPSVEKTTVSKKKKDSHHLLKFFGLSIF
ncbi:MAG: hypothetical protein K2W82_09660 [Candidatus Obscuribacterales bacterium]|nr:hypothetical protein [Candidatus Obscuribacterales bacterium]